MTYVPSQEILEKYADVMVNYGLGNGEGVKAGDAVFVKGPLHARPLIKAVQKKLSEAKCTAIIIYDDDEMNRALLEDASLEQIEKVHDEFYHGLFKQTQHTIKIVGHEDPEYLKGLPTEKTTAFRKRNFSVLNIRQEYELAGKHNWTLVLYPSEATAKEANMAIEEYWQEIVKACYLDKEDTVGEWKKTRKFIKETSKKLNALHIESLRVEAPNTDLIIKLGEGRIWGGGDPQNIPTFENFVSPDWRGTQGHIQFTEPLYYNGGILKDVYLEFTDGLVTKATASQGEDLLKGMISIPNANKVGEYSLTDGRVSNITKFMAETLFDENVGGPQGNTHLALGFAYKDLIDRDPKTVTKEEYERLGYNTSDEHTDIMSTSPRKVTATLPDGSKKVIYENGQFTL